VIRQHRLTAAAAIAAMGTIAVGFTANHAAAQSDKPAGYRVVGVGDMMMGSDYPNRILHPDMKPGVDPVKMLGPRLARLLKAPHVTFGNIEGTIHSRSKPAKFCRNPRVCYVFRMPVFYAKILRRTGFNLGSLANNHAGDFLGPGRTATYRNVTQAGIKVAGLDQKGRRTTVLTLKDGTRVGLAAFAPNPGTVSINKHGQAKAIVRALSKRTDFVIVSFHGGAEGSSKTRMPKRREIFLGENRGDVWRFSRDVVDAGADIVFGHGPHVPRAIEVYKGRFIAYSLGNFWTYGRFNIRGLGGIAPVADLRVSKTGKLLSARIHSVKLRGRGVPRYDTTGAAIKAVRRLTRLDFPKKGLKIANDGRVTGWK